MLLFSPSSAMPILPLLAISLCPIVMEGRAGEVPNVPWCNVISLAMSPLLCGALSSSRRVLACVVDAVFKNYL